MQMVQLSNQPDHVKMLLESGICCTDPSATRRAAMRRIFSILPLDRQLRGTCYSAKELGHLDMTKENVGAAIRLLYKLLLGDLRPP